MNTKTIILIILACFIGIAAFFTLNSSSDSDAPEETSVAQPSATSAVSEVEDTALSLEEVETDEDVCNYVRDLQVKQTKQQMASIRSKGLPAEDADRMEANLLSKVEQVYQNCLAENAS